MTPDDSPNPSHNSVLDADPLLDRISDAFYALDREWTITQWNKSMAERTGQDPEEVVGTNFWGSFPEVLGTDIEQQYRRAMKTGETCTFQTNLPQQPFENWLEVEVYPGENGLSIISRDITERKRKEEQLKRSQRRLQSIIQNTQEAIYIKNRQGEYTFINQVGAQFFERDPEEILGCTDQDLIESKQVAADIREDDQLVIETGQSRTYKRERTVNGETFHFIDQKFPYRDKEGNIVGLMAISRDVTEREQRRQTLEQAETLFENTQDSVFVIERRSDRFFFKRVNPAYEEFTGLNKEELVGRSIMEVFKQKDARSIRDHYQRCLRKDRPIQYEEQLDVPEENSYWDTRIAPVRHEDGTVKIVGMTRNITEQKRRENKLKEVNRRLELVIESANLGTWDWDLQQNEVLTNRTWTKILGYDSGELVPEMETWRRVVHPDDLPALQDSLSEIRQCQVETIDQEVRVQNQNSEWTWIRIIGEVVKKNDEGEPIRATGIHQNISRQKELENELRETNQRLEKLLDVQEMISEKILQPQKIKKLVVDVIQDLTDSAGVVIEVPKDDYMVFDTGSGIMSDSANIEIPVDDTLAGLCFREGTRKYSRNVKEDDRVGEPSVARELGIQSMLMIPLEHRDDRFGVLNTVSSEPDGFGESDQTLLGLLADLLSSALWQSQQYEQKMNYLNQIETLSREDSLTGLRNRRVLLGKFEREVQRTNRYGGQLSFALLDIDHFKTVNDQYGHQVGDDVLRVLAEILREETRASDTVGRYGGEEFGLIFPETSLEGAEQMVERILKTIRDQKFEADGQEFSITVSIGVTDRKPQDSDPEAIVKRADDALYKAKKGGRDQYEKK